MFDDLFAQLNKSLEAWRGNAEINGTRMTQVNTDRHGFYSYTNGYEGNAKVLLAKTRRRKDAKKVYDLLMLIDNDR